MWNVVKVGSMTYRHTKKRYICICTWVHFMFANKFIMYGIMWTSYHVVQDKCKCNTLCKGS